MIQYIRVMFVGVMLAVFVFVCTGTAVHAADVKDGKKVSSAKSDKAITELANIPLAWKPTETISSFQAIDLTAYQNVTLMVKPFNDVRKRPSEIGRNVEKRISDTGLPVTTKDNVAAWLTENFMRVCRDFDIDVAKNAGNVSLEADIVKFFVTEEATYQADVALKVRLKSKSGDVVWEGLVSASSSNFGKSYNAENYYEGLSNSTIIAVHDLLANEQFQQAVRKNK